MRTPVVFGLLMVTLLAGCGSDTSSIDDDGDGLSDGEELNGWTITIDLVGKRISRHVTSEPNNPDTDGDGVTDAFELGLGLNPRSRDTDDDGLTDCQETLHTNATECEDPTWEGPADGGTGTIANNADSDPGFGRYINNVLGYEDGTGTLTDDLIGWGDGIPDGRELEGYVVHLPNNVTVTVKTDPMRKDSDGDFLEDGEEALVYGTHPLVPDTDGDGCADGVDLLPRFEERFDFGLQTLRVANGGQIRIHMRVVDSIQESPGGATGLQVRSNQDTDLAGLAGEPVRPAQCSFLPHEPWVAMELIVYRLGSDRTARVDVGSLTNPENTFKVYWNVASDEFAWEPYGEGFQAPISWSGTEGSISFHPRVLPPGGQTS